MGLAEDLMKDINDASLLILGDNSPRVREGFSSGSSVFNYVLTGDSKIGYVNGRIYELYGSEGSCKTTMCLHAIAEAQKVGKSTVFIDVEHALDPVYAKSLGVNLDELLLSQPNSGEHALNILEELIKKGAGLIVVDSVAALVPQAELEGASGDAHMGLHARLMSQAMRKICGIISKKGSVVIFVNQQRSKIGVVFGNPNVTTGGTALKYYASVRVELSMGRSDKVKSTGSLANIGSHIEEEEGNKTKIKIIKNKLHPPFKVCKVKVDYGFGINKIIDTLVFADMLGVIKDLKAKQFVFESQRCTIKNLENNNELLEKIIKKSEIKEKELSLD